jgi:hypothetical protein
MQPATLPDPRVFARLGDDPFVRLAGSADRADLAARMGLALERGHDSEVTSALQAATSPAVYRKLWEALATALDLGLDAGQSVVTRLFALPVLVVTGGEAGVTVPAVLPAVDRVRALFEDKGTLGQARTFGLSNALCDAGAIERFPLSRLYRITRGLDDAAGALDLPPAEIFTTTEDEDVHLRFLAGAAVTPAHAPSFLETGADIGAWGMALTRELSDQLKVDGVSVLPIPRPPLSLFAAHARGRQAREELACQAFVSRVLRRFRAELGEPQAIVASLASDEVGIRFASPFDPERVEIHRWRLTPLDSVERIQDSILELLRECRLDAVAVVPSVLTLEQLVAGMVPDLQ